MARYAYLFLAGLASLGSLAGAQAAGSCSTIRSELVRMDRGGVKLTEGPIPDLAKRPRRILTTDGEGQRVDLWPGQGAEILASEGAPAGLAKELKDTGYNLVDLHRAGALRMVEAVGGSLHCSDFTFFEKTTHGGRGVSEPPPVVAARQRDGSLCWTDRGYLAQIGGAPAFIRQDGNSTDWDYAISLSLWRGGRWSAQCNLKVAYQLNFRLTRKWCAPGVACAQLASQVTPIAMKFQAHPDARLGPASLQDATVKRMTALAQAQDNAELPKQMVKPQEAYYGLGGGVDAFFPIAAGGKTYVARLGHASVGWRQAPDYNMVVYTLDKGQLRTVAGFVVGVSQGRMRYARLSR